MQSSNRFAFKEWAAVCQAIVSGRQSILLRKGGIHERRGTFAVEHVEFWLFPTRFHQADDELTSEGRKFLVAALGGEPPAGMLSLSIYVMITDVLSIDREEQLPALRPFHLYADRILTNRFHYRRPGLKVLLIRAWVQTEPIVLSDSPHFAGCRTWVDLPLELPTAGLRPVLGDVRFAHLRGEIASAVGPTASI